MYARIEQDQVVEYPLYEGDLQNRFSELDFPLDTSGTPLPDGYVRVQQNAPELNPDIIYNEIIPIKVGDVFVQHWEERPSTPEEREIILEMQKLENDRKKIQQLISVAEEFRINKAEVISKIDLITINQYISKLKIINNNLNPINDIVLPDVPYILL